MSESSRKEELRVRLRGRMEAAAAILARQLAKRFHIDPEPFLPLLRRLDFVQYEELSEKILETENIQEIRHWLETASNN